MVFVFVGEYMIYLVGWFIEDLGFEFGGCYGCLVFWFWILFEGEKVVFFDE